MKVASPSNHFIQIGPWSSKANEVTDTLVKKNLKYSVTISPMYIICPSPILTDKPQ